MTESKYLTDFKAMITAGDYLILDTETTGLDNRAEICQIALIRSTGETLLNTLVKPVRPIPSDASRIHGIYDNDVIEAPRFSELVDLLKILVTGSNLVIYNAVYDRSMLHRSAEACGIAKTEWKELAKFWCAMEAFSEIYGEWNEYHGSYRWQKLTTAARHYGVPVENAHNALGDCLMTLGVVKGMVQS